MVKVSTGHKVAIVGIGVFFSYKQMDSPHKYTSTNVCMSVCVYLGIGGLYIKLLLLFISVQVRTRCLLGIY